MKTIPISEYQHADGLSELKAALLLSQQQGETVMVDFSSVDKLDLRWVQLLAAYARNGKPDTLKVQGMSEPAARQLALIGAGALFEA